MQACYLTMQHAQKKTITTWNHTYRKPHVKLQHIYCKTFSQQRAEYQQIPSKPQSPNRRLAPTNLFLSTWKHTTSPCNKHEKDPPQHATTHREKTPPEHANTNDNFNSTTLFIFNEYFMFYVLCHSKSTNYSVSFFLIKE